MFDIFYSLFQNINMQYILAKTTINENFHCYLTVILQIKNFFSEKRKIYFSSFRNEAFILKCKTNNYEGLNSEYPSKDKLPNLNNQSYTASLRKLFWF